MIEPETTIEARCRHCANYIEQTGEGSWRHIGTRQRSCEDLFGNLRQARPTRQYEERNP